MLSIQLGEDMKKLPIVVLVVLALSLSSMGCIIGDQDTKSKGVFYVGINVVANGNGSYIIYTPIPILDDGSTSPIIENLKITRGAAKYYLTNTKYGRCLCIEGNNSVELEKNGRSPYSQFYLSTHNGSVKRAGSEMWQYSNNSKYNGEMWVFCNYTKFNGNITVSLRVQSHEGSTGTLIYTTDNLPLRNGWFLLSYVQQKYPGPT